MKRASIEGNHRVALSAVVASIVIGIDPSSACAMDESLASRIEKARSANAVQVTAEVSRLDEGGQTMQFPNFPNYFSNFPNFPNYFRNY